MSIVDYWKCDKCGMVLKGSRKPLICINKECNNAGYDFTLLDKDTKIEKKGGGLRYNKGKAEISLVPSSAIFAIAHTLMYGAKKYKKHNWREGMSWMTVFDCAQRHMIKWLDGEEFDEESGLPHLYHAICNIAMLIEYKETYQDGDDRFKGDINAYLTSFMGYKSKEVEREKPE